MADINKINVNGTTYNINLPDNSTVSGLTVIGTLTAPNISGTTITATTANLMFVKPISTTSSVCIYKAQLVDYSTDTSTSPASMTYMTFNDDHIAVRRPGLSGYSYYYFPDNGEVTGDGTTYKLASKKDIKPLYLHTIAFQMNYSTGGGASFKQYNFYGNLQIINYSNETFTTSTLGSYISNIFAKNTSTELNVNGYIQYVQDQGAPKYDYCPVFRLTYNPGDNRYNVGFILDGTISNQFFTSIRKVEDSVIEIS